LWGACPSQGGTPRDGHRGTHAAPAVERSHPTRNVDVCAACRRRTRRDDSGWLRLPGDEGAAASGRAAASSTRPARYLRVRSKGDATVNFPIVLGPRSWRLRGFVHPRLGDAPRGRHGGQRSSCVGASPNRSLVCEVNSFPTGARSHRLAGTLRRYHRHAGEGAGEGHGREGRISVERVYLRCELSRRARTGAASHAERPRAEGVRGGTRGTYRRIRLDRGERRGACTRLSTQR
jgi:hypothetical protein